MSKQLLMKCGCVPNATDSLNNPVCVIHDCEDIEEKTIDLKNRKAICAYCHKEEMSSFSLPFFQYQQEYKSDSYYCGCMGWD